MSINTKMTAIADEIRALSGTTEAMSLDAMASNVSDANNEVTGQSELIQEISTVLEAKGHLYDVGVTDGRKLEYDEFWSNVYPNLDRVDGTGGFPGRCWNDNTFNPPQVVTVCGNCNYCFFNSGITDISDKIEFSSITSCTSMFQYCRTQVIGELDFSKLTNKTLNRTFDSNRIVTIQLLTVGEDVVFSNTFADCKNLVNLAIAGTIGQNGLNLQWSTKLSKESITSLINALSATASGLTVTLSATAVNTAFETSSEAADGSTSDEWTALANTRTNWTISLV